MKTRFTQRARALRQQSTEAEKLLWRHLRAKQLSGVKFRRQEPIGEYIVDFVCFSHRLVIELDGGQHAQPRKQLSDQQRDAWLREQGFKVLRFWDNDVLQNIEGVVETIHHELSSHCSPPPDLPHQGGGTCTSISPPLVGGVGGGGDSPPLGEGLAEG